MTRPETPASTAGVFHKASWQGKLGQGKLEGKLVSIHSSGRQIGVNSFFVRKPDSKMN